MKEIFRRIKRLLMPEKYDVRNRLTELEDKLGETSDALSRYIVMNQISIDSKLSGGGGDFEKQEVFDFFANNHMSIFPYEYARKYKASDINVYKDEKNSMNYVLHNNKKMYFPKQWSLKTIKNAYNGLLIEQDEDS
ncbi:MAG: hypothetical protein LBB93_00580, partial [Elusimicrobiota bacterium]|nr:hypothetical protein [Elusimicrobiota bacterium]